MVSRCAYSPSSSAAAASAGSGGGAAAAPPSRELVRQHQPRLPRLIDGCRAPPDAPEVWQTLQSSAASRRPRPRRLAPAATTAPGPPRQVRGVHVRARRGRAPGAPTTHRQSRWRRRASRRGAPPQPSGRRAPSVPRPRCSNGLRLHQPQLVLPQGLERARRGADVAAAIGRTSTQRIASCLPPRYDATPSPASSRIPRSVRCFLTLGWLSRDGVACGCAGRLVGSDLARDLRIGDSIYIPLAPAIVGGRAHDRAERVGAHLKVVRLPRAALVV